MKKRMRISLIFGLAFLIFSAVRAGGSDFVGTYGVCENDPSQIALTLNDDHTFAYRDFSDPNRKIDISGVWELKNNHIVLEKDHAGLAFHHKWKISQDGMVAKSRKGICFYKLVRK